MTWFSQVNLALLMAYMIALAFYDRGRLLHLVIGVDSMGNVGLVYSCLISQSDKVVQLLVKRILNSFTTTKLLINYVRGAVSWRWLLREELMLFDLVSRNFIRVIQ